MTVMLKPIHSTTWSLMRKSRAHQCGLSLLLALLLLAIISVVAVGSMQNANLQERIAGNSRDRSLAYNAAESAIREAEEYLDTDDVLPVFLGGRTAGHYVFNTFPSGSGGLTRTNAVSGETNDASSASFWDDSAVITFFKGGGAIRYGTKLVGEPAAVSAPLPGLTTAQQPLWILELMPKEPDRAVSYRISALGFGRTGALVLLQSHYTPRQRLTSSSS